MTLADARARIPRLEVIQADPAADLALLLRLSQACRRFTPALALHAPDGLDLDVSGCAALFGGEGRLLMAAGAVAQRFGVALRSALADTPALAYAAARFGRGGVVAAGVQASALAPLPVEALQLGLQGCKVLRQLGFRRIGQLLDLPRPALARRLGEDALRRLDEALGARAGPLELSLEPPVFRAERRLFEPISEAGPVLQVAGDLAAELALQLDARGQGGRRFALELYRVDGAVRRLAVAASRPLRHAPRIAALFAECIAGLNEGLEADFGFDQLRLTAERVEPLTASPGDLIAEACAPGAVEALADRLAARGAATVSRLSPVDAHGPDRAQSAGALEAAATWAGEGGCPPARYLDTPLRPLRLFRPPQPIGVAAAEIPEGPPARFTWRRVVRTVVRAEGPERLEPEWALDPGAPRVRDYYRLEDEAGRRYWVFRQDRYDAPDPAPELAELAARREAVHREKSRREEIKPVRPPPKPPVPLRLVRTPLQSPHPEPVEGRGDAHPLVVGGPASSFDRLRMRPTEDETAMASCVKDEDRSTPAWFLHGLFG